MGDFSLWLPHPMEGRKKEKKYGPFSIEAFPLKRKWVRVNRLTFWQFILVYYVQLNWDIFVLVSTAWPSHKRKTVLISKKNKAVNH